MKWDVLWPTPYSIYVERLKVVLTEDEIAYHGNVKDSSLSMSISCLSTS